MKITRKDLNNNYRIARKVFCLLEVLQKYCFHEKDIEDIEVLYPIIDYARDEADKICFNLFNLKYGQKERAK